MTHAVIIRFHYDALDPRFLWRFSYFSAMVFPRLLAQTVKDFDIAVWCNPAHAALFEGLSPRIRTFSVRDQKAQYKIGTEGNRYFYDFAPWSDVQGLPQYDIQSGVDSDDLVHPLYLELIQEAVIQYQKLEGEKTYHVSFQPYLFDLKTLQIYRCPQRYHERKGSAFLSLYQPDKSKYAFIYERSHLTMYRLAKRSLIFPEGYCWATTHDLNESTKVGPNSKPVP